MPPSVSVYLTDEEYAAFAAITPKEKKVRQVVQETLQEISRKLRKRA